MESEREVDLMTPLSARTYLAAYHELDEADDKRNLRPLVAEFTKKAMIPISALKETWPQGDWQ